MTETKVTYYVRIKKGQDDFTNAKRDGQTQFDYNTAIDVHNKAIAAGYSSFLFKKEDDNRPVLQLKHVVEPEGVEL